MKKFYTLLAAAAVTVSSSAAVKSVVAVDNAQRFEKHEIVVGNTMQKAPAKAAPSDDSDYQELGIGTVSDGILCDYLGYWETCTEWEVTIEQCISDPSWYRTVIYNDNSPAADELGYADESYFYFNVSNPEAVYSDLDILYEGYYLYQYCPESGLGSLLNNSGKQHLEEGKIYGSFKDNVVYFPDNAFWLLDYTDEEKGLVVETVNAEGSFRIALPGATIPALWKDLGYAEFKENILCLLFEWYEFDENGYPVVDNEGNYVTNQDPRISTTMVQERTDKPNVFRLVTPWLEWYSQSENELITTHLTIDLSNPACGVINEQRTGVIDPQLGEFSIATFSSGLFTKYPDAESFMADPEMYPSCAIILNEDTREITLGNYCALVEIPNSSANIQAGWYNVGEDGITGYIKLPENTGVGNIVVEEEATGVAEYYNLQGVRVQNPESGLYIVKQGNKVSKVLVK